MTPTTEMPGALAGISRLLLRTDGDTRIALHQASPKKTLISNI